MSPKQGNLCLESPPFPPLGEFKEDRGQQWQQQEMNMLIPAFGGQGDGSLIALIALMGLSRTEQLGCWP